MRRLLQLVRRHRRPPIVVSCPRVSEPLVCLTFDDGPSPWTELLLDLFAEHDAKATFFVLGVSIEGNEHVLRRIVAEGHEVGNHTYSHLDLAEVDDELLRRELQSGADAIAAVIGEPPRLLRPPYKAVPARVARIAAGLSMGPVVSWSVDPADWRQHEPQPIVDVVLAGLEPGAIVDLHDGVPPISRGTHSRQTTVDAVAILLPELRRRGYRLVTVSQLLAASA